MCFSFTAWRFLITITLCIALVVSKTCNSSVRASLQSFDPTQPRSTISRRAILTSAKRFSKTLGVRSGSLGAHQLAKPESEADARPLLVLDGERVRRSRSEGAHLGAEGDAPSHRARELQDGDVPVGGAVRRLRPRRAGAPHLLLPLPQLDEADERGGGGGEQHVRLEDARGKEGIASPSSLRRNDGG